jgi:hypothetical protein
VILLYNRAPELASLPNCNSVPSKQCFPIPPWPYFPASANHYSILNFYEVSLLDSIYEWDHAAFMFLCMEHFI